MTEAKTVFLRLLTQFENAAIERSWKGGKHPDIHAEIEEAYERKKKALIKYVLGVTQANRDGWKHD